MIKKFLVIVFVLVFLLVTQAFAESNSGFIPGQIWYSNENLIEGQTVNVYTAVWNGEKNPMSAKVEFYDKNVILGSRDIVVNPLEIKEVFVPWKITGGDHLISAKITSSSTVISGKKESITLDNNTTSNDKQFVSVSAKDNNGNSITENKINSNLENMIPKNMNSSFSNIFSSIENFRNKTHSKLVKNKENAQKEISLIKKEVKKIESSSNKKNNIEDTIRKPVTYMRYYLLLILTFIFATAIVFYGLFLLVIFYILRFIYRKIRNR